MIHRSVAFLLAVVDELDGRIGDPSTTAVRNALEDRAHGYRLGAPQTDQGCAARLQRAQLAGLVTQGAGWWLTPHGREELAAWRRKHGGRQPWGHA